GVDVEGVPFVFEVDEAIDDAIAVASQVSQSAAHGRLFVESMHRHDREELIDGPDIRCRLKDGEVTIIDRAQCSLEVMELLGDEAHPLQSGDDLLTAVPVQSLVMSALS